MLWLLRQDNIRRSCLVIIIWASLKSVWFLCWSPNCGWLVGRGRMSTTPSERRGTPPWSLEQRRLSDLLRFHTAKYGQVHKQTTEYDWKLCTHSGSGRTVDWFTWHMIWTTVPILKYSIVNYKKNRNDFYYSGAIFQQRERRCHYVSLSQSVKGIYVTHRINDHFRSVCDYPQLENESGNDAFI